MESMNHFRERFEALAQQMRAMGTPTRRVERRRRWWRGIACAGLLVSLLSLAPPSQAADFTCPAGDVACLIDAITQANANEEAHTITLEAGTYTLTTVDNDTDGSNGLPSVTGIITIQGAGVEATSLERMRARLPSASGMSPRRGISRSTDSPYAGLGTSLLTEGACLTRGGRSLLPTARSPQTALV
jgi:hypothetical protein